MKFKAGDILQYKDDSLNEQNLIVIQAKFEMFGEDFYDLYIIDKGHFHEERHSIYGMMIKFDIMGKVTREGMQLIRLLYL